jgi:toxin ParE1/3/4
VKWIVIREAAARTDLRAIGLYIGQRSPQAARRFIRSAEQTIARLATHPGIGEPYSPEDPAFEGIRLCVVTRFRSYVIVYRATEDRVEILRVLHGARDIDQILADDLGPPG